MTLVCRLRYTRGMEILAAGIIYLATHLHGGATLGASTQGEAFAAGTIALGPVSGRLELRLPVGRAQPAYLEGRLALTVWSF